MESYLLPRECVVGSGKAGLPGVFIASIPYLLGLRLRISKLMRRALR
jgi:hypothetical protein